MRHQFTQSYATTLAATLKQLCCHKTQERADSGSCDLTQAHYCRHTCTRNRHRVSPQAGLALKSFLQQCVY